MIDDKLKAEIKAYQAELLQACEEGNLEWFRARVQEQYGDAIDDLTIEMTMHKVRHLSLAVSEAKRLESQKWLAEHDCHYLDGKIKVGDPLPGQFDGCH